MVVANDASSAEFAIIISYPTSARRIIVLLKTSTKYIEFFPTLFVKTTHFQLVFNTISGEDGYKGNQGSRMPLFKDSVFNN